MPWGRIKELEELIFKHKVLYYRGTPEIEDEAFDSLEEELRHLDKDNRVLSLVGSAPARGKKMAHAKKMLSLSKVYDLEELEKWRGGREVVSTYKLDGVSCSLVYEGGHFALAKTRGDGSVGEKITEKVRWVSSVPRGLGQRETLEVRGELFCTREQFRRLSQEMVEVGLEKPTHQRNIVAGLVSRKDHLSLCRYLDFKAFDLLSEEEFETEEQKYGRLRELLFDVPKVQIHRDLASIERAQELAQAFMAKGDYLIDGLVFTFNETALHRERGETSHHPRYKMAFKSRREAKATKIREIMWQVSRNGILTPVALVEPTLLSSAKVERVSLHNLGIVRKHRLREGDSIEVIRSGEVIPKFVAVVGRGPKGPVSYPRRCPSCRGPLKVEEIRLRCPDLQCPDRVREGILHFVSHIGIDDLSTKRLEEMMNKGLVKAIPDLYRLTVEDLLGLDKTKEKLALKLHGQIQSSRHKRNLATFLAALGLAGGGINRCEKVVEGGFDTVDKILRLTLEDLLALEGFAEKSAEDFLAPLREKESLVRELLDLGFSFEKKRKKDGLLVGKRICITGTLKEKRATVEARLREQGALVVGSISRGTDILVQGVGKGPSSKLKKAQQLGVSVVGEEELKKLMV